MPLNRKQKENALAAKLPPESKRGVGANRKIMLTGDIAKAIGRDDFTVLLMSELSDKEIDRLFTMLTRRSAYASTRDQLLKLGSENASLQPHLRPVIAALDKTSAYSDVLRYFRKDRPEKLVLGPFIRVSWTEGSVFIVELPGKGKKQLKWMVAYYDWLRKSLSANEFLSINLWNDAKIGKNDTYQSAVNKLRKALDTATTDTADRMEKVDEAYIRQNLRIEEDTVWYLNVAPGSAETIEAAGRGFQVTVGWNSFESYSPDSEGSAGGQDPSYTKLVSKSPSAARTLYKILNNDPDALSSVTWDDLPNWLRKNKIAYDYKFSVWR